METTSFPSIGRHVPPTELIEYTESCQIFLHDPTKFFDKGMEQEYLPLCQMLIGVWKGLTKKQIFVHGSYCINLANEKAVSANAAKHQLTKAEEIGASGLVIHVGKRVKRKFEDANHTFLLKANNILKERGTEACPLLIETPAGVGTEMYVDPKSFSTMIWDLRRVHGNKVGSCVDTAHVWGAGYTPMDYVNQLDPDILDTIKLIHYNGSLVKKGAKKDRHAPIFGGEIPVKELGDFGFWAKNRDIPLVAEW